MEEEELDRLLNERMKKDHETIVFAARDLPLLQENILHPEKTKKHHEKLNTHWNNANGARQKGKGGSAFSASKVTVWNPKATKR